VTCAHVVNTALDRDSRTKEARLLPGSLVDINYDLMASRRVPTPGVVGSADLPVVGCGDLSESLTGLVHGCDDGGEVPA
jgi:hypothetical protein